MATGEPRPVSALLPGVHRQKVRNVPTAKGMTPQVSVLPDVTEAWEMRRLARELGLVQLRQMELDNGKPFDRAFLAQVCRAAAIDLGLRILADEFPVRDAGQAAKVLRDLVEVMRLESGQATQITSTATLEDVMAQMNDLADKVRARAAAPPGAIEVVESATTEVPDGA